MACSLSLFVYHSYSLGVSWEFECALPSPSLQFSHQAWQEPSAPSHPSTLVKCPPQSAVSGVSVNYPVSPFLGVWQYMCSRLPEAYHTTNCSWTGLMSSDHTNSDIYLSLHNSPLVIVEVHIHLATLTL